MEEFIASLGNYLVWLLNLFQKMTLHFYKGERNTLKMSKISLLLCGSHFSAEDLSCWVRKAVDNLSQSTA